MEDGDCLLKSFCFALDMSIFSCSFNISMGFGVHLEPQTPTLMKRGHNHITLVRENIIFINAIQNIKRQIFIFYFHHLLLNLFLHYLEQLIAVATVLLFNLVYSIQQFIHLNSVTSVSPPTLCPVFIVDDVTVTSTFINKLLQFWTLLHKFFNSLTLKIFTSSVEESRLPDSNLVLINEGSPKRYRLHTEKAVLHENGKVSKWTYGIKDASKPNKIVLLVGETGTGKTTLINTMVNYLLEVTFEEEIWYEITEEAARDQSESQTSEITMYEVFPVENPVSLTIIDTPGYGDTRGLEKDLEVAENLSALFQSNDGVREIDAVCFVIQASKNCFSDRQHYIISSVLSLFGKDIVDNIVFLITHSDGLPPKNVIGAINKAKIPCRRDESGQPVYFLFNNQQADHRQNVRRYLHAQRDAWEDSMEGIKTFLESLDEKNRRSLELTSDVLMERIQFKAFICNLQLQIQEKEQKKAEKLQIQESIMQNKENIEKCKNFTITVKKTVKLKVPIESKSWKHRKATTCTVCEENCHEFDCWWGSNPSKCEVMKDGYCTVCTGKCHHSKHVKENKKYVSKTSTMTMTFDSFKKEYEKAQKQTQTFLVLMQHLDKDLKEIEDQKFILLFNAYRTIKHLSQIALKLNSAFTLQHLDFFIPRVREAGKENWVRELEEMRRNAEAEESNKDALSYLQAGLSNWNISLVGTEQTQRTRDENEE
ncbi:hypothetical protein ROHU_031700 [Labeo rohita]|uniref:AIG1-type G domain-containing protein n=1 Tax=Labeo rohita TaxID=84645 RepID=A0A498LM61_LABRO|nr:hypothetical protein ROHU_031700 [Labeo rohita]